MEKIENKMNNIIELISNLTNEVRYLTVKLNSLEQFIKDNSFKTKIDKDIEKQKLLRSSNKKIKNHTFEKGSPDKYYASLLLPLIEEEKLKEKEESNSEDEGGN